MKYEHEDNHTEEETSTPGIEVLDLDLRTYNALKRAGVNTIADAETQMEQLENIIPKKIEAVRDSLAKYKGTPTTPDSSPAPTQLQKSYLDIFKEHYPNVDCDALYGDYCPAGFFDGAIDDRDSKCFGECGACWNIPAEHECMKTGNISSPHSGKRKKQTNHQRKKHRMKKNLKPLPLLLTKSMKNILTVPTGTRATRYTTKATV